MLCECCLSSTVEIPASSATSFVSLSTRPMMCLSTSAENPFAYKLELRPLGDGDTTPDSNKVEFEIAATPHPDEFTIEKLCPASATSGPYHKPKSKRFESIDAFYLARMDPYSAEDILTWNSNNRLIMFQMTISKTHPVNALGIIMVLKKLGLLEEVKKDPNRVALVLVVPHEIADSYKRQEIVSAAVNGSERVLSVRGIGVKSAKKLAQHGITTIDELMRAIDTNTLPDKTISSTA